MALMPRQGAAAQLAAPALAWHPCAACGPGLDAPAPQQACTRVRMHPGPTHTHATRAHLQQRHGPVPPGAVHYVSHELLNQVVVDQRGVHNLNGAQHLLAVLLPAAAAAAPR